MGIWIRSQDEKKLVNVNELWRDTKSIYGCHNTTDDAGFILGTYADDSEAMQVLDMIQTHIVKIDDYHRTGCYEDWVDPVFQMQPAGFLEEHGGD